MANERGQVLIIPDAEVSSDREAIQPVLLISPFCGNGNRSKEELEASFKEHQTDTIEEVCCKHEVFIEGQYEGLDNETQTVSIPAINEDSFTPSGLTLQDPGLFQLYITHRAAEHISEMATREVNGLLNDEQKLQIETDIEQIEQSLKGVI